MAEFDITYLYLTVCIFIACAIALFINSFIFYRIHRYSEHRTVVTNMVNLAVQDLMLNLWFTCEILDNPDIKEHGTHARYWFDGLKQLNLSLLTNNSNDYSRLAPLLHLMDVDNKKLDSGDIQGCCDHCPHIQQQLLSWAPSFNALIQQQRLQIPPLPEGLLAHVQESYRRTNVAQQALS